MKSLLPIAYMLGAALLCGGMVMVEAFPTESFIVMAAGGILLSPLWVPWLRQRLWPRNH